MKNPIKRLLVYPADLKNLMGKSDKSVYIEIKRIKERFGLGQKDKITIFHVKDYYHVTIEELELYLIGRFK